MQTPAERSVRFRNIAIGSVIVLAVAALIAIWNRDAWLDRSEEPPPPPAAPAEAGAGSSQDAPAPLGEPASGVDVGGDAWATAPGETPVWPGELSESASCDEVDAALSAVCRALDARGPAELTAEGGACRLLEGVATDLARRPPALPMELRRPEAMLANIFHAYRVLGGKRMRLLRALLDEHDLAEPAALAIYRWSNSREACDPESAVRGDILYDYGTFLFSTFGGQAYLRRRSPRVEALACFYALHALDRSIAEGRNPHGFDPRPELPRCRDLVAAQSLVFGERYLEELDAVARRLKVDLGPP